MLLSLVFALLFCSAWGAQIGSVGPKCAACGFAINELEGFLSEPREEQEIEDYLNKTVCSKHTGFLDVVCVLLMKNVPLIMKRVDDGFQVSRLCMDLGLCDVNVTAGGPDGQAMAVHQVNMDLAPVDRWKDLCALPHVSQYLGDLLGVLKELLGQEGSLVASDLGKTSLDLLPEEFADEIRGCAAAANLDVGLATLLQMSYELTDACTSIVAQDKAGKIYHARNLDFGAGGFLTATLRNVSAIVEFTKQGQVVARETTFLGYIGVLSGQRPGKFTLTINTRFYQGGVKKSVLDMLGEFIFALSNYPNAHLGAFLARDALMKATNYEEAVQMLSNTELIADIYYTVSGVNPGEGVVITRNRTGAVNSWHLGSAPEGPGSWFVLETNYDHWQKAPWFDDRMDAGYANMEAMGQDNITLDGLYNVLSQKPTLNLLSAYSLLAVNANSTYESFTRFCQFPCAL